MTEEDWGDLEQVETKRSGFPKWLLFCGGGCLLMVVRLVVAGIFVVDKFKEFTDPDVQYPKLEEHIAFDHRLDDHQLFGVHLWGEEAYLFFAQDKKSWAMFLVADTPEEKAELEKLFDPNYVGDGEEAVSMGARQDAVVGTIEIQGRELRVLRAQQESNLPIPGAGAQSGATIMVDLSAPEATTGLVLMYMRNGQQEPVGDEEVAAFLAPFHVGSDRSVHEAGTEESRANEELPELGYIDDESGD
jgi:hypothetical protein